MPQLKTPKSKIDPKVCYTTKVVLTDGGMVQIKAYDFPIYRKEQKEEEPLRAVQALTEQNEASAPCTRGRQAATEELKQISASSLSRTRNNLIEYTSQNRYEWKSFITLTFAENITEVSVTNPLFHQWVKDTARKCKKRGMEFKYIAVPEFQDRGAVHYHLMTNLPCDSEFLPKRPPKKTYNKKKKKWYTLDYYDIPYWSWGNSSAFDLDMADDKFNVALYITKYLYKDIDHRLFGRTKFMHSHNLDKPNRFYLLDDQVYLDAMAYIESRGYDIKHYRHDAKGDYDRSMDIYTTHMIEPDDLDAIRDILSEKTPQTPWIPEVTEPKTSECVQSLDESEVKKISECQERGKTNGTNLSERHQILEPLHCSQCEQVHAESQNIQGIRPEHGVPGLCEQRQGVSDCRGHELAYQLHVQQPQSE